MCVCFNCWSSTAGDQKPTAAAAAFVDFQSEGVFERLSGKTLEFNYKKKTFQAPNELDACCVKQTGDDFVRSHNLELGIHPHTHTHARLFFAARCLSRDVFWAAGRFFSGSLGCAVASDCVVQH